MKKYLIVVVLLAFSFQLKAQFDSLAITKNILAAEDSLIALFKRKDWQAYANYMHPGILTMMGGKESFVEFITATMKALEDAEIQQYKKGAVLQLVKTGNEYQCIIETFMQMKYSDVLVSGSSYDIAVSTDGATWTFLRIDDGITREMLKTLIPGLSPDLKLPKSQMHPGKSLDDFLSTYKIQYMN